jgi:hypothetical protein
MLSAYNKIYWINLLRFYAWFKSEIVFRVDFLNTDCTALEGRLEGE